MKLNNSNMSNSTGKAYFMNGLKLNIASVIFCLCALVLQVGTPHAQAAPIETNATLDVVADIGLRSNEADTNQDGPQVIVGNINGPHQLHGLVRFDTSTMNIPNGSTIQVTGVVLNTVNANQVGGSGLTIQVYGYPYDFGETTATWNNPAGDGSDATAGGTTGLLLSSSAVSTAANATNIFGSSSNFVSIVETATNGGDTINLLLKRNVIQSNNSFTRFLGNDVGFQLVVTYELTLPPAGTVLVIK